MAREQITRRQKNISRMLREKMQAYAGKLKMREGRPIKKRTV